MARARNIKPGFFKNYDLADLGPLAQLLFAGLWCMADKEGRLEDKPRLIKAEVFPYYDVDVNGELTKLARLGFVNRYQVGEQSLIEVCNFKEHQSPHHTEKPSTLPMRSEHSQETSINTMGVELTVKSRKRNGGNPPDSLIHRFTDSPIHGFTDSQIPEQVQEQPIDAAIATPPAEPPPKPVELPPEDLPRKKAARATWDAYCVAYHDRYGAQPVRNAKVNAGIMQFVDRLEHAECPAVANFFVLHNNGFYVREMHAVGLMVKDAEKLRTEWATNTRMTQTKALQADKTATNLDAFAPLIAAAKAKEEAERTANA